MGVLILPKNKAVQIAERIEKLKNEADSKMLQYAPNQHSWYYGYVNANLEQIIKELKAGCLMT